MSAELIAKIRRGFRKPPRYIVERLVHEVRGQAERRLGPARAGRFDAHDLAQKAGHGDVAGWWRALAARPFVATTQLSPDTLDRICPGERARILADAERALGREVDLLGSGPVALGTPIDWHKDYKTGIRWEPRYCRDIAYSNLDQPSDVKFPWEISRMQWLIPAAQAYALTGDERFAAGVRDVIAEWIAANPYAMSVNWACTMDVAIRAMTWTWAFHLLGQSRAWSEPSFQRQFLRSLWLHGDFTARHLEKSDVNGNHYTADAAGLVFIGLFFGGGAEPACWQALGWDILSSEIALQVFPDGVDFEASVPYHRLVQELFLLPALYRLKHGLSVAPAYRQRLLAMARFTDGYSRVDGSVPLWGDADDARALPARMHPINDHRYLLGIAGLAFDAPELQEAFSGPRSEIVWLLGPDAAERLVDRPWRTSGPRSVAFREGGFYVLRNVRDHVFVDCGPLGLAGRGGHGHNDITSFEAALDGVHLVSDCGAYLYTASMRERNNFRSTAYHNVARIDGEEINRFQRPDYLWTLHNDAQHVVEEVAFSDETDRLCVGHTGYGRLADPVGVRRTFVLDHRAHALQIHDVFAGEGSHDVAVALHLAAGVSVDVRAGDAVLEAAGRQFRVAWAATEDWRATIEDARVSPSYGVVHATKRIVWRRQGALRELAVTIAPVAMVDAR
ncbi:MAG: alginate lyase family protein [Hyphomicrobiaceae bacterium]